MERATVVLGCQWGDEGKGKVVDRMAGDLDVVVRFQGGANAGHTVKVGGETTILHLLPTGVLREGVRCLLGGGMVIDPWTLLEEFSTVAAKGTDVDAQVRIASGAHLVMPYHKKLDSLREEDLSRKSIGTTGRGIGPAYEDKMARMGLRVGDLLREDGPLRRYVIEKVLRANRILAERFDAPAMASEAIADEVVEIAQRLRPLVVDSYEYLAPLRSGEWSGLLEGAQGALLDIDHGTYPFVTSSNCSLGGALTGTGLSHKHIGKVVGVYKAYATRVGNGPFPSELHGDEAESLRARGAEFGATTGRPRRCGWFDAVAARYAAEVNGLDEIVLTKLDVLSGESTLRIAAGYDLDGGGRLEYFPARAEELEKCRPAYEELPGWEEDLSGATSFGQLPQAAQDYVARLEELVGVPVRVVSHGPGREAWLER